MNRHTKRLLALAGSALVGAFGAVALASPAQAHHPIISGKAECQADGQYKVTWKVSNGDWQNPYAKITKVKPTPNGDISNIFVGGKVLDIWLNKNESVSGVQFVTGDTKLAKLWVEAEWYLDKKGQPRVTDSRTGEVKMPGTCEPTEIPKPTATGESTCDKFTITIANPQGGKTAEATITYGTQEKKVTVEPGKTEKVELSPSSETEAKVVFAGLDGAVVVEYKKPGDCADLPRTGDDTLTYVGTGTGIAGLGVLVFFLARRRLARLRRLAS